MKTQYDGEEGTLFLLFLLLSICTVFYLKEE
jgi:hypothetical protein